jgi:nucleotide-binding universal stress UspA family protein
MREDGKMIKKILLGLGGTPYTTVAIQRAVKVAKHYGAEITGVTTISLNRLKGVGVEQKESAYTDMDRRTVTRELIEEAVSLFESACSAEGIKFQIKHEEMKDSFSLMISLARYHDVMIFGLRSIFEYGISFEEPKDTLARLITAGVRPIIAISDKFRTVQRVLIAYDGSMESAKTMKQFMQLRLWPDAKLKIVTFQKSEDKAHQLLYDASEYCRAHGFHVDHESNPGSPKDFLLPMATQWQADMIVLGNSARSLLMKRVLGETALHIIRNADRPLFLSQ